MNAKLIGSIALVALTLAGCTGSNRDVGVVAGALAGGVLGNQIGRGDGKVLATVAGAAVGGLIGGAIGDSLDQADRQRAAQAEYNALESAPSGRAVKWANPDRPDRTYGTVVAGPSYEDQQRTCRPYTHTIYIDGTPQTARGTACRNADGTWRPVG